MRILDAPIRFTVNIDKGIPDVLHGDATRIRQVLINVLGNAVKYTDEGSISLSMGCEFIDNDSVNLVIEIADSGRGIKQEDMDSIFDEFIQVEQNDFTEGVGLGLAITNNLLKAMGGSISVESKYRKGSTFKIILPQKQIKRENTEPAQSLISNNETLGELTLPEAKVLIVDDVSTNLTVARGLLQPYKMKVVLCGSGMEALEEMRSKDFDMVFMDHKMPDMDGIEVTRRIRDMGGPDPYYSKLPIVALTANAISGTKEMFLKNGFNDFLSKPIELAELKKIVERWIPKSKHVRLGVTHVEA